VLVGWSLATATLGLAAWAAAGGPATLSALLATDGAVAIGVLSSALLTAVLPPRWWRRAAPGAVAGIVGARTDDGVRWLRPLRRRAKLRARDRALTPVRMPGPLRRASRRARSATPPRLPVALEKAAGRSEP